MNKAGIHLIFGRFYKDRLFMVLIITTLPAAFASECIIVPQAPAYAETGSGAGNASTTTGVEKSGDRVFSIMQQQLRSYRQKLEESEGRLQDFQRKHGIILRETQMSHLLSSANLWTIP